MPNQIARGLIELTTAPTEAQAGIIQSVLNDAGIESRTQKAPGFDSFGLGTIGIGLTTITVRAEDADRAREALDANRQDSVDLDWSEVNVGEPEDEAAARIAARPERSLACPTLALSAWFPTKPLFVWIVLLALGIGLADWYIPFLMLPIAAFDLVRRASTARRSAFANQPLDRSEP